jgi:hypothetical protein
MAYTPPDNSPAESASERDGTALKGYAGGLPPPPQRQAGDRPRLIEEHHAVGPYGEDELEATDELGRRWYHLRPEPRRRYDLIGFNYTWWFILWIFVIFIIFLPWGHGWGY